MDVIAYPREEGTRRGGIPGGRLWRQVQRQVQQRDDHSCAISTPISVQSNKPATVSLAIFPFEHAGCRQGNPAGEALAYLMSFSPPRHT